MKILPRTWYQVSPVASDVRSPPPLLLSLLLSLLLWCCCGAAVVVLMVLVLLSRLCVRTKLCLASLSHNK